MGGIEPRRVDGGGVRAGHAGPARAPRFRRYIQVGFAVLVGALAIRYLRAVDTRALGAAMATANRRLLVVCVLLNAPLVLVKARRLRRLSGADIPTTRVMGFFFSSYAADNLLMSQAGLGVRVALLHREGVTLARAISAQAVDKACEAVGLGALGLGLLASSGWMSRALTGCVIAAGAAGAVVIVVAALPRPAHPTLNGLTAAARELRSKAAATEVLTCTMAGWALEVAMAAIALRAVGVPAPALATAATLLVAVNMAALLPGLPANLGSFEMACLMVLHASSVSADRALAFALLYHAAHTVPVTLLGLITWKKRGQRCRSFV